MKILQSGQFSKKFVRDFGHEIECLDPLPLFRSSPDRQLFLRVHGDSLDRNHPNAAGHELLGKALFAAMQPGFCHMHPRQLLKHLTSGFPISASCRGRKGGDCSREALQELDRNVIQFIEN
jgi:hypothetical protein